MRVTRLSSAIAVAALSWSAMACGSDNSQVTPSASNASIIQSASSDASSGGHGVAPELADVRAATAAFHNIENAKAAGYTISQTEPCAASPAGGMGVHAPNQALIQDPALNPLRPEVLLFEPKQNGGWKLVAVEYLKILLLRNKTTGAVAPWVSPTPWDPALYDVAVSTPQLFGQTFDGPMPGHAPTMPWHWDLHAWIWTPNPNGVFAQWNPSVSCN